MRAIISFLLAVASLFAGQSIDFGPKLIYNPSAIPNTPTNRLEFYVHDWSANSFVHLVDSSATGWLAYIITISPTSTFLLIYNRWGVQQGQALIELANLPEKALYVRMQHDPVRKLDMIEAWDIRGNRVSQNSLPYVSENAAGTAFQIGYGNETLTSIGFMRLHNSLVPMNSRPPVTSDDANRVFEWKFDGNLSDSSGNGHPAAYYNGTAAYRATPFQNVVATLRTSDSTTWANILTQRAGYPATLDGSASYSQTDSTPAVTCFWQQLSGPSPARFSSRTSCKPVLTGLVFGDYKIRLTVTSANGISQAVVEDIGVVAMDDKGVVVNADPKVDELFGSMIAYGKNPWGFADYWSKHAMEVRAGDYASSGWNDLQWEKVGAGTVSYYWNGVGYVPGNSTLGTKLTAAITTTSTTFTVADASKLDFRELPTRILLLPGNFPQYSEEVRICSVSGNTLTVCYDGRGQLPRAWGVNTLVGQFRIAGTGTQFVTDAKAPVCPVGAPGPPGPAMFRDGSVVLTPGSSTADGVGTRWGSTAGNTSLVGSYFRVRAAHGDVPFDFVAISQTGGAMAAASVSGGAIVAVNTAFGQTGQNYTAGAVDVVITDPTGAGASITANVSNGSIASYTVNAGGSNYTNPSVVIYPSRLLLNRAYPADADAGTFGNPVVLRGARTIVLRGRHAVDTSGTGEAMWATSGCESETSVYSNPYDARNSLANGWDNPALNGTFHQGFQYGVTDSTGWVNQSSTGGINFYGESLGSRALYYRSGLTAAKDAADALDVNLIRSPWGNKDVQGSPALIVGGMGIGGFASAVLGAGTAWSDMRSWAAGGEAEINATWNGGTPNCEYNSVRDTAYAYTWVILGAMYDPDTSTNGYRARWRNALTRMQANDQACKRTDNSWSNGFYWNRNYGPLTLTNNSATVRGTNIPSSACNGFNIGAGSVVSGSATVTITTGQIYPSGSNNIVITGTKGGQPFTGSYLFSGGGTSITLSVLWPGDSGSVTWMATNVNLSTNDGAMMTFATSISDYTNLKMNHACAWVNSTTLLLDRPWAGQTGSNYYGYSANLAGFGQQPFFLGIKAYGMGLLARSRDPQLAGPSAAYKQLHGLMLNWVHDNAVDPATLTTNYGRGFQFCEPATTHSGTGFDQRTPGCNYGRSLFGRVIGREQNQELGNAVADYYMNDPTDVNKAWGDSLYGAIWGDSRYNTGGVFVDEASDAANLGYTNLIDSYIHQGKWYGFFAGMGMLHRWPAVRLGGVDPPALRPIQVPFSLSGTPGASQVRITVTQPSGATASVVCSASPCAVEVDARSGSALMQMQYLGAASKVLATSDTVPLYVDTRKQAVTP